MPVDEPMRLDQFLKSVGLVGTGGEAKFRVQGGEVLVNDQLETRRGRKLAAGDRITLAGETHVYLPESGEKMEDGG